MSDVIVQYDAVERASADLSARPASLREIMAALFGVFRRRTNSFGWPGPDDSGPAQIISRDPLVIYTSPAVRAPMGLATGLRRQLKNTPATFLIALYGSIETGKASRRFRRGACIHRLLAPKHRIVTLCNTKKEVKFLHDLGEPAVFLNHNFLIGTDDFFPIADTPVIYDAVYNGRLSKQKRHHLALKVHSCAMIFYQTWMEDAGFEKRVLERHAQEAPGHHFVNRIGPDGPELLPPKRINEIYNQAHTGLCLSAVEGAMYSSIEYMLAGLPIVSTPSRGGRDVYFDADYCIIAEPNADAVRKAVLELKARQIPRNYIRARTLEKINADRMRFLDFLSDLSVPVSPDAMEKWPFPSKMVEWKPWRKFLADIRA